MKIYSDLYSPLIPQTDAGWIYTGKLWLLGKQGARGFDAHCLIVLLFVRVPPL